MRRLIGTDHHLGVGETGSALYVGDNVLLKGESALLRKTRDQEFVVVQVDRVESPYSHGWHKMPAKDWVKKHADVR